MTWSMAQRLRGASPWRASYELAHRSYGERLAVLVYLQPALHAFKLGGVPAQQAGSRSAAIGKMVDHINADARA